MTMLNKTTPINSWTLVLVIVLFIIEEVTSSCEFPSFLPKASLWTAEFSNDGILTVVFKSDRYNAKYCPVPRQTCVFYERRCIEEYPKNKFLVEHKHTGQDSNSLSDYMCIEFIKRSENIFQFRQSQKFSYRNPALCDESYLSLDHWPLFAPNMINSKPNRCPFEGGYNMQIHGPEGELCSEKLVLPRIESECEDGDGITFNFRYQECIHNKLKMQKLEHLLCVTHWEHGNFIFVILRPEKEFEAWCMRITKSGDEVKSVVLFMDHVCDPGSNGHGKITETKNYLTITLNKLVISSLCANEFEGCDDKRFCQSFISEYCHQTCNQCASEVDICSFPEHLRGTWLVFRTNETSAIHVSSYDINIPQFGKFQCIARNVSNNQQRTALLHVFENGCFPRFACLEMVKSASSVRQFRLGKRLTWPQWPIGDVARKTCSNKNFLTKVKMHQDAEEQTIPLPYQVILDSSEYLSAYCNLPESLGFANDAIYFKEGDRCSGCLIHDPSTNPDRIEVRAVDCNMSGNFRFRCLASLELGKRTHAVITGTDRGNYSPLRDFLCWVFTDYGKKSLLIVLDPADCNKHKVEMVLESDGDKKALFDIKKAPIGKCPFVPRIPRPALEPDIVSPVEENSTQQKHPRPEKDLSTPKPYTFPTQTFGTKTDTLLSTDNSCSSNCCTFSIYFMTIVFLIVSFSCISS